MSTVKSAPLQEVAVLNPRLGIRLADDSAVSFVPMTALSAEEASISSVIVRPYGEVRKGYTCFESGDVLVAKITPCFENGKIAQALLTHRYGFGSTEFHVVRPKPNLADGRYLHHFLRQPSIRSGGERRMTGSGGQRRVPESYLAALVVPVPPLPEQRRIAAILDQADALRAKRREALAQLESLAQSIFIEMFGDPVSNDRQWHQACMSDFVAGFETGKSLAAADEDDQSSEFRVLKISAVTSLEFKPEQSKALPLDYRPPQSHVVRRGDLLFSRANTAELIGATALVDAAVENLVLPDKLWRFVWHKVPRASPIFVRHLFRQTKFRFEIAQRASGTSGSMKNISQEKVFAIRVGLPPLSLQQAFATRIQAVESLKTTHRAALAELDALFASLQHRAFAGQLL